MKTPAISGKILATIPVFISSGMAALFIWNTGIIHYFAPLILGVIAGGLVDLDNGLTGKLKNILFTVIAFSIASLSVQLTFHNPVWFTATFTLLSFVFTLLGVAGLRYRTIAFGTLAVGVYTALTHDPHMAWYMNTVLILCGTLLYSGTTVLAHLLFPHRPVQENMAAAYDALARYLQAKAAFFDPDEAAYLEQQQINLALGNTQVIAAFNQCRSALFYRMRGQHRHPRTAKMLRYYFVAQDIHERISSSHVHYQAFAEQMKHSDLIFRIGRLLELQAQACREFAAGLRHGGEAYRYTPKLDRATRGAEASLLHYAAQPSGGIAPYRVQRLLDNIVHVSRQFRYLGNPDAETETEADERHDRNRIVAQESGSVVAAWRALQSQFTFESPVFRHAVRMAVITLCGCVLVYWVNGHQNNVNVNVGYWILLTAIFVCQPNYSATKARLVQRIAGTVAGVLVGTMLPYLPLTLEIKLLIVMLTTTLFFLFRTNKHSFSTFFITIQAILGFSIAGYDVTQFFLPRIVDTVIGASIAGLAVYFLWPDWHYLALEKTGAQAIRSQAAYLRAILSDLVVCDQDDDAAYRLARRRSHEKAAELSSTLSDMSGEQKKYADKLQDGFQLLKINYSLISYISALGAYRSQMRHNDDDRAFLVDFFRLAEQAADLLEQIDSSDADAFYAAAQAVLGGLDAIRPSSGEENGQSEVLWQQLRMIGELLWPCYCALNNSCSPSSQGEAAAAGA